jgi:hypothetical protein
MSARLMRQDIQDLLRGWSDHVANSATIVCYAPGANARALYDGPDAPLRKCARLLALRPNREADPRVRSVPIIVRRPTRAEVRRVHFVLWSCFLMADEGGPPAGHVEEEEGGEDVAEERRGSEGEGSDEGGGLSGAGALDDSFRRVLTAVRRGALKALSDLVAAAPHVLLLRDAKGRTALHHAALRGGGVVVTKLLELGADPTARDNFNKAPYFLSAGGEERDAFRRFVAVAPDQWDYEGGGGIPGALTPEMEAKRLEAKRKEEKEREKERERRRRRKEKERGESKFRLSSKR